MIQPDGGERMGISGVRRLGATHLWALMLVLVLAEIVSSLEISMIYTALPKIIHDTGDLERAGWLQTGYLLAVAGTAAVAGRLGDLFGRRLVLIVVLALCALGSAVSALSSNLDIVIAGRAIQGASGAILPLCYGIARANTPPEKLPYCISWLSGAFSTASGLGFLLGGVLTQVGGWHSIFALTALYTPLVILPVLLVVPRDRGRGVDGRFDWGGLLFVPAATLLALTLSAGTGWGWLSSQTLLVFGGGVVLLAVWIAHELRHRDPLLNIRLLARREILIGNLVFALAGLSLAQLPLVLMLLIQQPVATTIGFGVSPSLAGILKIPSNALALVAAGASGLITRHWGDRASVLSGALLGLASWLFVWGIHDAVWEVVAVMIAGTFAWIMLLTSVPTMILSASPVDRSSEASGLSVVIKGIFTGLGAQIATLQLATSRVPLAGKTFPSEAAYQLSFGFCSAMILGIVVIALFLRPQKHAVVEATAVGTVIDADAGG